MEKQTAVEWFAEQDTKLTLLYLGGKIKEAELGIKKMDLFHKALAKEKEQIVRAFNSGDFMHHHKQDIDKDGYEYYNETYNTK
jgi:hypothetical protein